MEDKFLIPLRPGIWPHSHGSPITHVPAEFLMGVSSERIHVLDTVPVRLNFEGDAVGIAKCVKSDDSIVVQMDVSLPTDGLEWAIGGRVIRGEADTVIRVDIEEISLVPSKRDP